MVFLPVLGFPRTSVCFLYVVTFNMVLKQDGDETLDDTALNGTQIEEATVQPIFKPPLWMRGSSPPWRTSSAAFRPCQRMSLFSRMGRRMKLSSNCSRLRSMWRWICNNMPCMRHWIAFRPCWWVFPCSCTHQQVSFTANQNNLLPARHCINRCPNLDKFSIEPSSSSSPPYTRKSFSIVVVLVISIPSQDLKLVSFQLNPNQRCRTPSNNSWLCFDSNLQHLRQCLEPLHTHLVLTFDQFAYVF